MEIRIPVNVNGYLPSLSHLGRTQLGRSYFLDGFEIMRHWLHFLRQHKANGKARLHY
jgi:hypothetical protein